MKRSIVYTIIYFILGALLLIGPYTLFKVCEVGEKPMRCYWSTKAIGTFAVLLIASAILHYFVKTVRETVIVNTFVILIGILVALIPSVIIGGCGMKTMACQSITFPAFYFIAIVTILTAVIQLILAVKKK